MEEKGQRVRWPGAQRRATKREDDVSEAADCAQGHCQAFSHEKGANGQRPHRMEHICIEGDPLENCGLLRK